MDGAGDSGSRVAITVEWNLPSTGNGPKQPPVTRYPINGEVSMKAVVEATEKAKSGVNEILTHVVEKGKEEGWKA